MNSFLVADAFINVFLKTEIFSDNFTVVFLSVILDVLYFAAVFLMKISFFLELVFFSCKMRELKTDNKNNKILSLEDEIRSSFNKVKET